MIRLTQSLSKSSFHFHRRQRTIPYRWFSSSTTSSPSSSASDDTKNDNDDNDVGGNEAEWIPPNRPLSGDRDNYSQLYRNQQELDRAEDALFTISDDDSEEDVLKRLEEALELEERLEKEREEVLQQEQQQEEEKTIDWLATRRKALGLDVNDGTAKNEDSRVPIVHHELMSEEHIVQLLESVGGSDITILSDDPDHPRMGGATGMVLCTAGNQFYINSITKQLVDHLKERQLQDLGVLGAQMGKNFLSTTNHQGSNNWTVVDCQNYIVHVFDQKTRDALNLEDLWRGKDPLWRLDTSNDDAVEDYVAKHHVPNDYGPNPEDIYSHQASNTISKLQRQQWLAPHRPVIPTAEKLKDRRAGRRRRRERMREQQREF